MLNSFRGRGKIAGGGGGLSKRTIDLRHCTPNLIRKKTLEKGGKEESVMLKS